jgi:hypothetical protein
MADTLVRNFRVYIGFSRDPDGDLNNMALGVISGMTNNPVFPNPPAAMSAVSDAQVAFSNAITDARNGGKDRTRIKNAAKQKLGDLLVKNALYCQSMARHNLDDLLSTGYDVVSTNRTPALLDQPSILGILNDVSGQLTVRGKGVLNGRLYQVQLSEDNGVTWASRDKFNGPRRMVLALLTSGKLYWVRFCALGGSTGQSPWSNPVSCMST